jgi:hypothetical protein
MCTRIRAARGLPLSGSALTAARAALAPPANSHLAFRIHSLSGILPAPPARGGEAGASPRSRSVPTRRTSQAEVFLAQRPSSRRRGRSGPWRRGSWQASSGGRRPDEGVDLLVGVGGATARAGVLMVRLKRQLCLPRPPGVQDVYSGPQDLVGPVQADPVMRPGPQGDRLYLLTCRGVRRRTARHACRTGLLLRYQVADRRGAAHRTRSMW